MKRYAVGDRIFYFDYFSWHLGITKNDKNDSTRVLTKKCTIETKHANIDIVLILWHALTSKGQSINYPTHDFHVFCSKILMLTGR